MANVERLRKLRQRILDHQEQFRYTEWGGALSTTDIVDGSRPRLLTVTNKVTELKELLEAYSCNTCGCVAGHACMQAIEEKDPSIIAPYGAYGTYIAEAAQQYLDLNNGERRFLFMGSAGYNLDFLCDLPSVDLTRATIHDAIERLDVLIEYYK